MVGIATQHTLDLSQPLPSLSYVASASDELARGNLMPNCIRSAAVADA